MNGASIAVMVLVTAALVLALVSMKKHPSSCSCGGKCSGGCSGCPMAGKSGENK